MTADDRSTWTVTTHDWTHDVDVAHLEGVRRARAEYERGGRRHQILEVLAYADEEAADQGRIGNVVVRIMSDGMVAVTDDGRGTDTRRDSLGRPVRKPVMATADQRFFEADAPPLLPDGLPRRGISTVAALSSWLSHENHRADGAWSQEYRRGVPSENLHEIPSDTPTGTTVRFISELGTPAGLTADDLQGFPWLEIQYADEMGHSHPGSWVPIS
ncbi:ATP-binding protein [Microbacterium sp. NPDC057650]|uniref:ATP-binding protein n=1 Tax=unclassified Microbacterium TaxID=2609290 RepID=UPI00366E96C6